MGFRAWLGEILFPAVCLGCGAAGTALCARCEPAAPLVESLRGLRLVAAGPYEGPLRLAVLALKRGRSDAAQALARVLAQAAADVRIFENGSSALS
ncbi:MAG: hypothetical protein ACREM2_08730, partial [Vulcanimicrobiaceae bacterium]